MAEQNEDIAELSAMTIKNALGAEIKERFGDSFSARHSVVVALVERPRDDLEGPDAPRYSLLVKNLDSVHPGIAINMLREAISQFQAKQATLGGNTQR